MKKMIYGIITLIFVMALGLTIDITSMRTYADSVTLDSKECQEHDIKTVTIRATLKKKGQIVEKCASCGATISENEIVRIKSVKLSKNSYTYNGKTKKPEVIIKDSAGKVINSKDYKVTYQKGRKLPGWYKVVVKFKGQYSGKKTLWFKIKPKGAKFTESTSGKTNVAIKVKRYDKNITGYQIKIADNLSNIKTRYKSSKNSTIKISHLEQGKKYYVAVRTYKTVKKNGKNTKVYSSWSQWSYIVTKGEAKSLTEPVLCYEMLDLVNEEREARGLEPMTWSTELEEGTLIRAYEQATSYGHTRPDGSDSRSAFSYCGGAWSEIVAKRTWEAHTNPNFIFDAWMNSSGHRGTIIVKNYVYASIESEDSDYIEEDGSITHFNAGDIHPGIHASFEMCCAYYKNYWVMIVNVTCEEEYWELQP